MNKIKAMLLAAGIGLVSAPASAVVVSGIDFGPLGSPALHIETMTLATQFINPTTTTAGPSGTVGNGTGLGYGLITTINGNVSYCSPGPCSLYYIVNFGGGTFTAANQIEFTSTSVTIYYSNAAPVNLFFGQNSPANLATIAGFTPYATLVGHGNLGGGLAANVVGFANGTLSGSTLNLSGNGLLDVNTADGIGNGSFEQFLNGNGIVDAALGLADIAYTESANNAVLNPNDVATGQAAGCSTGQAASGAWCWQGTLNTRGVAAVPEPSSIALLSLGLLFSGFVARRKRA